MTAAVFGEPSRSARCPAKPVNSLKLAGHASFPASPGRVANEDGLRGFGGVQVVGCEHQPRVVGGGKGSYETAG